MSDACADRTPSYKAQKRSCKVSAPSLIALQYARTYSRHCSRSRTCRARRPRHQDPQHLRQDSYAHVPWQRHDVYHGYASLRRHDEYEHSRGRTSASPLVSFRLFSQFSESRVAHLWPDGPVRVRTYSQPVEQSAECWTVSASLTAGDARCWSAASTIPCTVSATSPASTGSTCAARSETQNDARAHPDRRRSASRSRGATVAAAATAACHPRVRLWTSSAGVSLT